jgi:putative transposase
MAKPLSEDLRDRVVGAVERERLSCRAAAKRFGVGVSTAISWVRRFRETGSSAPGRMGGYKPRAICGAHREWLIERCGAASRRRLERLPLNSLLRPNDGRNLSSYRAMIVSRRVV